MNSSPTFLVNVLLGLLLTQSQNTLGYSLSSPPKQQQQQQQQQQQHQQNGKVVDSNSNHGGLSRRSAFSIVGGLSFLSLSSPLPGFAMDASKPSEFQNVGTQAPAPEGSTPFQTLDSGVKVKDFRPGSGDVVAQKGTKVSLQLTGRLLNLNGVIFYDSKKNDPDGFGEGLPITFVIGEHQAIPGLEEGVVGMKKGAIRRIIVPPNMGYDISNDLLEPVPFSSDGQRALDSVIRNSRRDSSLLFDVKLERLK